MREGIIGTFSLIPVGGGRISGTESSSDGCGIVCNITDGRGHRAIYTGQPVDSTPYTLQFVVTNESETSYQLNPLRAPITNENCHFYIQFTNPVLLADAPYPTTTDPNWTSAYYADSSNLVEVIYLAWTSEGGPLLFEPGLINSIRAAILYQSTTETNEEVNVTVFFNADAFTPTLPGDSANGVDFSTELIAGYPQLLCQTVGPATILNDGATPCSVVIRINNPSDLAVSLPANSDIFRISIDTVAHDGDDGSDAALTTTDQVAGLSASLDASLQEHFSISDSNATGDNNLNISWTVSNKTDYPLSIGPNSSFDITLGSIVTSLPPGITNIGIEFLNVLEMQNQVHFVPVSKTPFSFQPCTLSGNGFGPSKGTDAPSGLSLYYKNTATSAPPVGALFVFKTENVGLGVVQENPAQMSAVFRGGAGVVIDDVSSDNYGLRISHSSSQAGLTVSQTGSGTAADFAGPAGVTIQGATGSNYALSITSNQAGAGQGLSITLPSGDAQSAKFSGGSGVSIDGVGGSHTGLSITTNSTGSPLAVSQTGSGPTASFDGGAGLTVSPSSGSAVALTIDVDSTGQGLLINQSGAGRAVELMGGGGLYIHDTTSQGAALEVDVSTTSQALKVNQSGAGPSAQFTGGSGVSITGSSGVDSALTVTGSGATEALTVSGKTKLSGNVEIDGSLTVNGLITLNYQDVTITLKPMDTGGATLEVMTASWGPANIKVWDANVGHDVNVDHNVNVTGKVND